MLTIKRSTVLKHFDIKETSRSYPKTFSIKFIKKNGELVYLQKAIACGLRANMKGNRLRAAQLIDDKGNKYGHIYPICIDNIVEFNRMRVFL